jgi:DNA polymerase III epsilon subunit-like protein
MPAAFDVVVVDTETTGLDEAVHQVFEIAAIRRAADGARTQREFWLDVDLSTASPQALEVNRYHDRLAARHAAGLRSDDPARVVDELGTLCDGLPMAGMNPGFDVRFLTPLLARHGRRPSWHYSVVDIKALIAGALRIAPPWRSEDLARAIGIDPAAYARHGALGDCLYALDCLDAVFALKPCLSPTPVR